MSFAIFTKKSMRYLMILALVVASCQSKKEHKSYAVEKASWLIGHWADTSAQGILQETWTKANDSVLHGEAYFFKGKDTLFREQVSLKEVDGILQYIVTVPDQNDGSAVAFALTSQTDSLLVFENPKHDYPRVIRYRRITQDSIVATISGTQQGKAAEEVFSFKKK